MTSSHAHQWIDEADLCDTVRRLHCTICGHMTVAPRVDRPQEDS